MCTEEVKDKRLAIIKLSWEKESMAVLLESQRQELQEYKEEIKLLKNTIKNITMSWIDSICITKVKN